MRFLSNTVNPFRVFVTDLDILRPISSRTVAAKPPGRLDLLAGAPEVPEPATHSWAQSRKEAHTSAGDQHPPHPPMTGNIHTYGSPQSEHIIRSREPAGIILVNRKVGMHTLRKGAAMSLQLFELVPATPSREAAQALIAQVSQAVEAAGASVLESQVTASHERVFTIVEDRKSVV